MSLYGALFSSVAGIRSQSNKVGVISDNIANVNTVGYKETSASFETLVTGSGQSTLFSPGGVLSQNRSLVSKQGLIQGTDTETDIALIGSGFFVVKDGLTDEATTSFTRAGSFRQDSLGNFRNASGFYLQGWPLDRDGRLPGEAGNLNTNSANNLSSLTTVNVLNATGNAAQTTSVEISANLLASQAIFPGSSAIADMDQNTNNYQQPAKSIIAPGYLDGSGLTSNVNSIQRSDKFTVSTGNGLSYTYVYSGFTYSRDAVAGTNGDSGQAVKTSPLTLLANPFTTGAAGSTTVTVTAASHGLTTGDVVTLSGNVANVDGIPAAEFNDDFVVTVTGTNTFTITTTTGATAGATSGGTTGVSAITRPFTGNILDASSTTQRFLANTGTSGFTDTGLTFTITTDTVGTLTFTYTNSTPNAQIRQFNTMENLADAINAVSGLTARVTDNRLYVASADANEAITFANGSVIGDSGPPVKAGIDWVRELGLSNIASGENRFHSLQSLADLVNNSDGISATLTNALTEATLTINVDDPLDTISFDDLAVQAALAAFTSATPFGTTSGSDLVTITHPAPHGFITGDIVDVDLTGVAGHNPTAIAGPTITTTAASSVVQITQTGHGYTTGQTVYIDGSSLGGAVDGIPISEFSGIFTLTVVDANNFTVDLGGTTAGAGGAQAPGGSLIATRAFNGIPSTDLDGKFEITNVGASDYQIQVATSATATGATGDTGLIITPHNNSGSLLAELGLVASLEGAAFTPQSVGPLGPVYAATNSTTNMAGGTITPQFTQNVRVFDSLGTPHDLQVSFIKTATNTWSVEIYTSDPDEINGSSDGLLASGSLTFNGDGSLRSVSAGLVNDVTVTWNNGAVQSDIGFNWGTAGEPFGTVGATTIGQTDGMSQFDSSYRVNFVNQNGAPVGQLVSVNITEEGVVVANYSNGESQALYKIPIADFANPDQLVSRSGNVFEQSGDSGEANLKEAGTNGAGTIQASALEASTVDISAQLTDLIIAQRSYQANTKLITTSDQLLEELNNTLR